MIRKNHNKSLLITGVALLIGVFLNSNFTNAESNSIVQINLNPTNQTEGKSYYTTFEAKPGEEKDGVLTIKNSSSAENVKLKIYAVDSAKSNNGAVGFRLKEDTQNLIGDWITFKQGEINLKPDQESKIAYVLKIPEKVTPGTYQGGLIAEISPSKTEDNSQIKVHSRVVEPIIVSIPGRKVINYSLDQFEVNSFQNPPVFHYKFNNSGNVFLKAETSLSIQGTLLNTPYQTKLGQPTILQGDVLDQNFEWSNAPFFGHYQATLTFQVKEYNIATGDLKDLQTITKTIEFNIIPWSSIILALLLISFISYLAYYLGKKRRAELLCTFTHQVKKGETLLSIAELYQTDWKKIVRLNNLKKPYAIKTDTILTLPFPQKKN